eukprot:232859-Hanusia_phi.AAC.1
MPPRRIFVLLALLCCCIAKTQGISCVVASQTAEPAAICLPSPRLRLRLVGGCADESRRDEEDQHKLATPSNGGHGLPEEAGVGLGIARSKDGHCFVARILQGSSAAESGEVEVKDRIIEVDGHAVKELSPADIGRLLKGKEGSEVEMIVEVAGLRRPCRAEGLTETKRGGTLCKSGSSECEEDPCCESKTCRCHEVVLKPEDRNSRILRARQLTREQIKLLLAA